MNSLSEWWANQTHTALRATDDPATRLALALTPVRSVIRVIDDHVPPMSVEWAGVHDGKSISATDFKNNRVIINPLPITEQKITTAKALDVVTGFAMHEASHGQHSRDRYKYLIKTEGGREVPAFRPMRIAAYLWNIAEDVRCEECTSREWPGFRRYFGAVLDYMWANIETQTNVEPKQNKALVKRMRTVFTACRYPGKIDTLVPDEQVEAAWWVAWQDDYLTERVDTPTTIQRGLDRLATDKNIAKEMKELEKEEKKEEERGERARAQLDRLMREGLDGVPGICITKDGDIEVLDAETAAKVDKLVREQLIEMRPILFANGASNPPLHVRKPEETSQSRRSYVGRPSAEAAALRASLVFRPEAEQFDVKLLRQGTLDDEELYRWAMDDYRVFSERTIEAKPDVYMGLLVDMSGSMSGSKLKTAQRLAQLFVWALHDQEGIDTQVWAHTGDESYGQSVDIYRMWERGDPLSRLGLIDSLPHNNNYDGHAIAYVVRQVMEQPHPQKVVMVLSDGLPSGTGYGGERGMRHMREVCLWAQGRGVNVLQIAIDDQIRPEDQSKMFGEGNWFPYTTNAALPKQLTRIMGRYV